jgi:hypothetical protein
MSDSDAKEVMKITEVRHGELRAKLGHDVLKESRGRCDEDDVINVEQQVGDLCTLLVNKEGGVGGGGDETELTKKPAGTTLEEPT